LNEEKANVYIPVAIEDLFNPKGMFEDRSKDLRSIQVSGNSIIIGKNWGRPWAGNQGRSDVKGVGDPSKLTHSTSEEAKPSILALRSPKISNKEIAISIDPNYLNKKMKPVRSDVVDVNSSLGTEQVRKESMSPTRSGFLYDFKDKEITDTKTGKPITDEQRRASIIRSFLAYIQKNTEINWSKSKAEETVAKRGGRLKDTAPLKGAPERLSGTRDTRDPNVSAGDEEKKKRFIQTIREFESKNNVKILMSEKEFGKLELDLYDWAKRASDTAAMTSGTGAKEKKGEEYIQADKITLNASSKLNPTIHITEPVVGNMQRVINDYAKKNGRKKGIEAVHRLIKTINIVNVIYAGGMDDVVLRDTLIRGIPEGGK
jgi:hypothetical protein